MQQQPGAEAGGSAPVLLGPLLLAADLQLSVDLGPAEQRQRLSLRGRRAGGGGEEPRGQKPQSKAPPPHPPPVPTHHVLDGQLEGGDLSDDLVVPLDFVHALRQVLQPGAQKCSR